MIQGTEEEKRRWLQRTVAEVIDSFATFKDLDVADGVKEPSEKENVGQQVVRNCTYSVSQSKLEKNDSQ